ncbi:hypothetical protein PENTCL1PPCAC_10760, partial [Pristionchus entomophagus]
TVGMVYYDFRFFGAPNYTYVFEDRKTLYRYLPKQPQDDELNLSPVRRDYFIEGGRSELIHELLGMFLPVIALISYNMLIHIAAQFHKKKFARNYQSAESSKQERGREASNRKEEDQDFMAVRK